MRKLKTQEFLIENLKIRFQLEWNDEDANSYPVPVKIGKRHIEWNEKSQHVLQNLKSCQISLGKLGKWNHFKFKGFFDSHDSELVTGFDLGERQKEFESQLLLARSR